MNTSAPFRLIIWERSARNPREYTKPNSRHLNMMLFFSRLFTLVVYRKHLWPFSKSEFNLKSDRVNLVAPASSYWVSALFTQCPGDTVQTGTGKVDPARKFKCTTAASDSPFQLFCRIILFFYFVKPNKGEQKVSNGLFPLLILRMLGSSWW